MQCSVKLIAHKRMNFQSDWSYKQTVLLASGRTMLIVRGRFLKLVTLKKHWMRLAALGMIVCNIKPEGMLLRSLLRMVVQPNEFAGSNRAFRRAIQDNVIHLRQLLLRKSEGEAFQTRRLITPTNECDRNFATSKLTQAAYILLLVSPELKLTYTCDRSTNHR